MRTRASVWFVLVWVLFCLVQKDCAEMRPREEVRLPLYIRKARELLLRQKTYQNTQERRMEILSKSLSSFAGDLYSFHANGNHGNGSYGNLLLSPLGAYASLAMMLTASRGGTKREVVTALSLNDINGVHHTLQRAFTSYRNDDNHDIDDDVSDGTMNDGEGESPIAFTQDELEKIMRNDYIIDNSISYSAGQTNLMFSDGIIASDHNHDQEEGAIIGEDPNDSGIAIRFANGMFHNEDVGLSQHFIMRLASLYGAPPMAMQQSDPEDSVNLWVDATTYGAISRVLGAGSLAEDTLLTLVSAAYFRAAWQEKFDEELVPLGFRTLSGDTVLVDCMYHAGNYSVKNIEELRARVLEIPYTGGRYSFFVILPNSDSPRKGLLDMEQSLHRVHVQTLLHDMPEPSNTLVIIPKFSLHSKMSLKAPLQALGAKRMFEKGKGGLGRMTDEVKNELFVSDIVQRVTFHVDEGRVRDEMDDDRVGVDVTDEPKLVAPKSEGDISEIDKAHEKEDHDNDEYHFMYDDPEADDDFEDYYDEDYDYSDYNDNVDDGDDYQGHFIVERPFLFIVKDNEFDLILLMGRVTNPLP